MVQGEPDISWSRRTVTMVRDAKWLNIPVVKVKPGEPTITEVNLCNATQVKRWFRNGKIDQAFLGAI